MSTKDCPSCGAVVPAAATRCKECFHDFTEDDLTQRSSSSGMLLILGTIAAMVLVGAATLWFITSNPLEERILVDEETQSVVWTRQYRTGPQTDRLRFSEIMKLEYVLKANGDFEVAALTSTGDRKIIQSGSRPLRTEANQYAKMMDKPLEEIDNTTGFHKMD